MTSQAEIGLIGLGVMGQSLALNIADHGYEVAVYNRTAARTESFAQGEDARRLPVRACFEPRRPGRGAAAAARDRAHGPGGRGDRSPDRRAGPSARAGRRDRRRRQRALPGHHPARARAARAAACCSSAPASPAARRAPATAPRSWPAATARPTPGCARRPRGDRRPGRRRAVLRPSRRRRRRALRQDDPQRHRICRHAADRRDLRPDAGRAGPRLSRDAGGVRRRGTGASSTPT